MVEHGWAFDRNHTPPPPHTHTERDLHPIPTYLYKPFQGLEIQITNKVAKTGNI